MGNKIVILNDPLSVIRSIIIIHSKFWRCADFLSLVPACKHPSSHWLRYFPLVILNGRQYTPHTINFQSLEVLASAFYRSKNVAHFLILFQKIFNDFPDTKININTESSRSSPTRLLPRSRFYLSLSLFTFICPNIFSGILKYDICL